MCDLLNATVEQLSFSGFTRNDQRASPDILALLRPGDLVIRDLGYFVLSVFEAIGKRGAFFLSRYRYGTILLDPLTLHPIPLAKVLKKQGFFDAHVLLGVEAKVPVRVVAVAVPEAAAAVNTYAIGILSQATDPGLARKFVDLVTGEAGQRVLAAAGFGPP